MSRSRIGLALGSGSARGWAHIGVLEALVDRGIEPDVVVGASAGSLVGAAYASGQLDRLHEWAVGLNRVDVLRLLDTSLGRGGMMSGDRLMRAVAERITDHRIEELAIPFAAVATQLDTGLEVWLREGSMLDAVRASSGLPGVFTPVWHDGRWLIDGGVVNSVPVSVCRALGAEYIIGVNLNRHLRTFPKIAPRAKRPESGSADVTNQAPWSGLVNAVLESLRRDEPEEPGIFQVIGASVSIMQDRIMRSRMVGDPPDIVIDPELGDFEIVDFHRAAEAIEIGRQGVESVAGQLDRLLSVAR